MQVRGLPAMTAYMRFGLMGCPCSTSEAFIQSMQNVVCRGGGQRIGTGIPVLTDDRGQSPACGCRLDQILFRYEAPALADAANGALRRDAEH